MMIYDTQRDIYFLEHQMGTLFNIQQQKKKKMLVLSASALVTIQDTGK